MSEKHTPGPWEVRNSGNVQGRNARCEIVKEGQALLATMAGLGEIDYANARLIAAAPDMLEACKECLEFMLKWDIKKNVISGLSLQLLATIVKAEGKR